MQRQLKFRAWDKLEKRFIYPDKGYQGHYVLDLNGRFQNLQNGSGGDEYVVQQWTGLKDSKGVDVYEGDIVEFLHKGKKIFSKITYYSNVGMFAVAVELNQEIDIETRKSLAGIGFFKIIGTIFETPELIKQ